MSWVVLYVNRDGRGRGEAQTMRIFLFIEPLQSTNALLFENSSDTCVWQQRCCSINNCVAVHFKKKKKKKVSKDTRGKGRRERRGK